jgi:hypothetical protein
MLMAEAKAFTAGVTKRSSATRTTGPQYKIQKILSALDLSGAARSKLQIVEAV